MNPSLYGCLVLSNEDGLTLPVPFEQHGLVSRVGNHLPQNEAHSGDFRRQGSFILASPNSRQTMFVPARTERIDMVMVGDVKRGEDYPAKLLLAMNSEPNDLNLADLVYYRIFSQMQGSFLVCLSQTGPHSRFIFAAKDIELYMLGLANKGTCFLVWSNEVGLEERMKEAYDNEFYYYRFPIFRSGSMVLQSQYLCARYKRWRKKFDDSLHIFSALENLVKKTIRPNGL